MKNNVLLFWSKLPLLFLIILSVSVNAQQLAFPGAEGFGRFTTGGRGGVVYEVTNLNDDNNPGSLRYAINRSGTRTIVFRVSGTIILQSDLVINNGNLTIAGQTAPGDGICIRDYQVRIDADNIIIRYLRFRVGNVHVATTEPDAFNGTNHKDIIIDHCSMSWSIDETGSFYDNENFTMQWCILSESLYNSGHSKGAHGYGGIQGGMNASFHHNLYANHTSRNPRFCGARYHQVTASSEIVDFRNNVIFNWGFQSIYGGEYGQQNMVNNYFKSGPATASSKKMRIVEINRGAESDPGKWYIDGNYVEGYAAISADNWVDAGISSGGVHGADANTAGVKSLTEFGSASSTIVTQTALDAYTSVLASAGASFPVRDVLDTRIMDEVQTGICAYGGSYSAGAASGIIDDPSTVGGWPTLNSTTAPTDTDQDGMPDAWETANGYIPTYAEDRNAIGADGYTALEKYLNCLLEASCPPTPTYTLTVSAGTGSGTVDVNPPGGTYAEGTVVTLTPTADADYIFQNWTGDVTGAAEPITVTMSADKNVTANFQSGIGMFFKLNTSVLGPGSVTFDPVSADSTYEYGTLVTVTAVPESGGSFLNWGGHLSGSVNPTTITIDNHKSITAKFLPAVQRKVAYVTDPSSFFYVNDTKILPALQADPWFDVTEVPPTTTDFSQYDLVILSEVPGSTASGMAALEGINKPFLMMKVHAYKSGPGAWNWITPTTGYGQNDAETNIVVSDKNHFIFDGVTFVNDNEVQMISAVVNSKGLTYMDPAQVTSVSDGTISSVATIKNNTSQSSIVQIPGGTTVSGDFIPQEFIQIGINSNSYENVTDDGVQIILNACYYLAESFDPSVVIDGLYTSNKQPALNVLCYPTTVNDFVVIDFFNYKGGNTLIDISTLAGKNVHSLSKEVVSGEKIELNMEDLHPGLYICKIQSKEGMIVYKIIKK